MSDLLFQRAIRVTFGKSGDDAIRISNLYMQVDVEKNSESEPNKATVSIHNMNETSRAKLQQKDVLVLVETGYAQKPFNDDISYDQLFVGQVQHASSEQKGSDILTTIQFQDGSKQFLDAKTNKSFAPGVTYKQVIESLVTDLKVGVGAVRGIISGVFQQGLTVSGSVRQFMDDVASKMDLEWSIQDNNFQMLPTRVPSEVLGFVLTPDNGLLGIPVEREDSQNGGKFLEFRALLLAKIRPGVAVKIVSRNVNAFFKVRRAHFSADNRIGPFEVLCEGVEIAPGDFPSIDTLNINFTKNPPIGVIA